MAATRITPIYKTAGAVCCFLFAVFLTARLAYAALVPKVSEDHTGELLPVFQAQSLAGQTISSQSLIGKTALIYFFASWCPACQMQEKILEKVTPDFIAHGGVVLGVLADSKITPDTVEAAKEKLSTNPPPYPIILLDDNISSLFRFEGFPTIYSVTSDGKLSTTLYGLQPVDTLRNLVDRLVLSQTTPLESTSGLATTPQGMSDHAGWETNPWLAFVPFGWEQWHPLLVHFPIAFLILEALLLTLYWFRPREELLLFSKWLLWFAAVSLILVFISGLHDAGEQPGKNLSIWDELQERMHNLLLFQSTISLHFLLALGTIGLVLLRLIWRTVQGDVVMKGNSRTAFAIATVFGLWVLFAACQVGGGITHH